MAAYPEGVHDRNRRTSQLSRDSVTRRRGSRAGRRMVTSR
jgi:hypothetical protein